MKKLLIIYGIGILLFLGISLGLTAQALVENVKIPSNVQMGINKTINRTCQDEREVHLSNPAYQTLFSSDGITFNPKQNELTWQWSLQAINGEKPAIVLPVLKETATGKYVDYSRAKLTERYLFHATHVEQLFLIDSLPANEDLCIEGSVTTTGRFEHNTSFWQWKNKTGAIKLGKLYVYDALGKTVPADFEVQAGYTSIYIAQHELVAATFPITIDPEIGANDFRISDMGTNGSGMHTAFMPDIAYNSIDDEYLVVWYADDNTGSLLSTEYEIFGQRLSSTGAEIGTNDFRISDMGPDGNITYDGTRPAITYNSTDNEYLVVWGGDDNVAPLTEGNVEVFGQRLSNTGAEIGANDFRISQLGPEGSTIYFNTHPAVAYNISDNEYLVVWEGEDNTPPLVNDEKEIFGQRLSNTGAEIGNNDFRISDMGPDSNKNYDAQNAKITHNSTDNEYLVVWEGNDDTPPLIFSEKEIFGQRLSNTGIEIGDNDFRISDMGPNGNGSYDAFEPDISYNPADNEYMVVWNGNDDTPPLTFGEYEVFGQRLSNVGAAIGDNDFRVSDLGPDGNGSYDAFRPCISYNVMQNEYMVVWRGDDDTPPLLDNEMEVFGQKLSNLGTETGENDFRISDMGPNGNSVYGAFSPDVIANTANGEFLVVWYGDDNIPPLAENEFEIFGQRITGTALPLDWLNFSVEKKQHAVQLIWQTVNEINNLGFEVQRSENGSFFTAIAWVDGKKGNTAAHEYLFKDAAFKKASNYYYRLKQVDKNGTFSYSKIEVIHLSDESNILIYPNPFQNDISIQLSNTNVPIQVIIYNQLGQKIHEEMLETNRQSISIGHLSNGIYQMVLEQKNEILFHQKLIKFTP